MDKQLSCDSSLVEGQELGDKGSYSEDQTALDRVRFDDNVSFIEANSPDTEADKLRTIKKTELESSTLREETAEELAMVVSPQPRRPTPSLNVELVPSIEVVTPWSLAEESRGSPWASQGLSPTSDNCDETPLLHVSTPTSDIEGESHNISNITVMTDAPEAENVTSISIEHESNTFYTSQEHHNQAMIPNDNIAFVSLEVDGNKSESVKIKIGGKETDKNTALTESFCEAL